METLTAMLGSLRPADSARSAETAQHQRPTSRDILAGGYNCQQNIPEPVECEFCGRKLYHEALVMGRTVLMFAPFPQRCTCDRAKAKWAEADAEEARQKAEAEKEAAQAKRAPKSRGCSAGAASRNASSSGRRQLHSGHPGAAAVLRHGQNLCRQLSAARGAWRRPLHRGNIRDRQNAPRGRHRLAAHRLRRPGRLQDVRRPAGRH